MGKPNLFFSTHMSYGFSSGSYWSTMISDLCCALDRCGVDCDLVEAMDNQGFQAFLGNAIRQRRQFIATFNFIVPFPDITVGGKTIFMQELFAAQSVTIFLDHPVHLAPAILRFEAGAKHHGYRPEPAPPPIYGVMEADHAVLLNDLGIGAERIFIFPQAGPKSDATVLPLSQRPIDYLFHGTIADLSSEDAFFLQHELHDQARRDAAHRVMEAVLSDREDVYAASKRCLDECGQAVEGVLYVAEFARIMNVRMRLVRRWRLLSGLSSLNIHFCGDVADSFRAANPRGVYLGAKNFADVSDLVGQSKIVLNDTINLRDAALMRFHYAMAQGCLMATESSAWFRSTYSNGQDVLLLDANQEHTDQLRCALDNLGAAQEIAYAGQAKQVKDHLWDHRIGKMLNAAGVPYQV